jgi:hypothetical protein
MLSLTPTKANHLTLHPFLPCKLETGELGLLGLRALKPVEEDPRPELVFATTLHPVMVEQAALVQEHNFRHAIPKHVQELSVSICK